MVAVAVAMMMLLLIPLFHQDGFDAIAAAAAM
jgi:hypothetical protein